MATDVDRAARDTVNRARKNDQNAIAMLVAVRRAAKEGNEKAKIAYDSMVAYAKETAATLHGDSTSMVPVGPSRPPFDKRALMVSAGLALLGAMVAGHVGAFYGGGIGWIGDRLYK